MKFQFQGLLVCYPSSKPYLFMTYIVDGYRTTIFAQFILIYVAMYGFIVYLTRHSHIRVSATFCVFEVHFLKI